MQVTVINVGYGDAILLQAPDGFTALLDGGSNLETEFSGQPYRIRCADYLQQQGVRHLDVVLISHIHEDHVCGLEEVFENCSVGQLIVPYPTEPFLNGCELHPGKDAPRSVPLYTNALNAYRRLLLLCREKKIPVCTTGPGDTLPLHSQLSIRVLAPRPAAVAAYMELVERAYRCAGDESVVTECLTKLDATSNGTSLLLRLEMGECVMLSAADSCPRDWAEVPNAMLEHVNILKLPHHGQIDSIDERFMADMPLRYVITTAASDHRYNSANPAVYQRLTALYPPEQAPTFLFSDEREYAPWFSQPEGYQAIQLKIDPGSIQPEFIKINEKEKKQ